MRPAYPFDATDKDLELVQGARSEEHEGPDLLIKRGVVLHCDKINEEAIDYLGNVLSAMSSLLPEEQINEIVTALAAARSSVEYLKIACRWSD